MKSERPRRFQLVEGGVGQTARLTIKYGTHRTKADIKSSVAMFPFSVLWGRWKDALILAPGHTNQLILMPTWSNYYSNGQIPGFPA